MMEDEPLEDGEAGEETTSSTGNGRTTSEKNSWWEEDYCFCQKERTAHEK